RTEMRRSAGKAATPRLTSFHLSRLTFYGSLGTMLAVFINSLPTISARIPGNIVLAGSVLADEMVSGCSHFLDDAIARDQRG
ncbi:MAG: hypothetical protein ABIU05_20320, partial [Nitrospirales bacterium]